MKVKFIYDKKIDQLCWSRYSKYLSENDSVFGISREIKKIIDVHQATYVFNIKEYVNAYEKFFNLKNIDIRGYLITTPFSMINDDDEFSLNESIVYYSIYTPNPSIVIAHELFHIFFEKYTKRNVVNYDEVKEYFTVLINVIFDSSASKGYPLHQKARKEILDIWGKTSSLDACLKKYQK